MTLLLRRWSLRDRAVVETKVPSLKRNFSWTALGNIVYAACQWAIIASIAHIGTPEMVGSFALGLAITSPVFQFSNLQLRGIQATDARGTFEFGDYLALRTLTTVVALIAIIGILLAGGYGQNAGITIGLVAGAKAVDAFSDVHYGRLQQQERLDIVSRALMLNGALSLLLVTAGLLASKSLVVSMTGYLVGSLAPLMLYVIPNASRNQGTNTRLRLEFGVLRRLTRTAIPLGIVMLLISLNTNVPRYFVEHQLGERGLGIFAALAYLIFAGGTLVSALGQAASPRLARYYTNLEFHAFNSLLMRMMVGGFALGVGGAGLAWFAGSNILTMAYGHEYASHADALSIMALAAAFTFAASFAGYGMTAARRFDEQIPVVLTTLLAAVLASMVLVPARGLRGAAMVLLVNGVVQLICSSFVIWRAVKDPEAALNEGM